MHLYKNGLLPNSFNDMFLLNCDVHSYNTRSKNSFRLPYCRTNVKKFSLRFQGPKIFYVLTSEIQNASSTALFNSKLKSFFSWYTHTLALPMLVCSFWLLLFFFLSFSFALIFLSFSFSFFHLHVQRSTRWSYTQASLASLGSLPSYFFKFHMHIFGVRPVAGTLLRKVVIHVFPRDRGGGGAGRAAAPPLFCAPAPTCCAKTLPLPLFALKRKIIKIKERLETSFSVYIPLYSLHFL